MKSFSSDCYNGGLFTILTVVLEKQAPGYSNFKNQAIESLKNLGIEELISARVLSKKENKEKLIDSLTNEFPRLLEESYGERGKLLYELGFWGGMFFLSIMAEQKVTLGKSLEKLRYICAKLGNPSSILDDLKSFERKVSNQEKIDIMEVFKFQKENHFWAIGNYQVQRRKRIFEVIFSSTLTNIPYIGNLLKELYEEKSKSGNNSKKKRSSFFSWFSKKMNKRNKI
jgi:hypothetical protein